MIIDIHTHTFPDSVAAKALENCSNGGALMPFTDGTIKGLSDSIRDAGVDLAVNLPIATRAKQTEGINRLAAEINKNTKETGIMSFGSLHPDNENAEEILKGIKEAGLKGIKLHPVFQNCYIDDPRMKRIIACASDLDLIIIVHAGMDISFPDVDLTTAEHLVPVLKEVKPKKMILAHMGSWGQWDRGFEIAREHDVYIDTAFTFRPAYLKKLPHEEMDCRFMLREEFVKWVKTTGPDRILFGTDSPWSSHRETLEQFKEMPLTYYEKKKIFSENAAKLLGLNV